MVQYFGGRSASRRSLGPHVHHPFKRNAAKKPRKAAGLSLPMWRATSYRAHSQFAWKSSVPPGDALSRSEMSGFYCGERPPAPDRLRPAEPTQHLPRPSVDGLRIVALPPRIVSRYRRAPCRSRCVRARPRCNRGSMCAGRCVRASRSPSGLCRAAHA